MNTNLNPGKYICDVFRRLKKAEKGKQVTIFKQKDLNLYKYIVITVLLLWAFFTSYGAFNMSLYFMQYNQYKVSTNSSEYWLISKRKIRDISRNYHVVEISNKVFLIV